MLPTRLCLLATLLTGCPGSGPPRSDTRILEGLALPDGRGRDRALERRLSDQRREVSPRDRGADGLAPGPCRALLGIEEHATALAGSAIANAGHLTVYQLAVPVLAGDLLRVRGQAEITNDYQYPVRINLRLLADGNPVGSSSSQNCISSGAHHMPLWADALWTAASAKNVQLQVQLAASRSGASPIVKIENGYGHLVVERYRVFPSCAAAAASGAALLAEAASDRSESASSYGAVASQPSVVYGVAVTAAAGDWIRLLGQATSGWTVSPHEMHGQAIRLAGTPISPWATENTPWEIQSVPLWTDAVQHPAAAGAQSYTLTMHGVATVGGSVIAGAGHLYALRFSTAGGTPRRQLLESIEAPGPSANDTIVANAGQKLVQSRALSLAAGDLVRATSYLELSYPSGFSLGISCIAKLELSDASGATVATSALAMKYVTQLLEQLPLRNELVASAAASGAHTLKTWLSCTRESASPTLTLVGGRTRIFVDLYREAP